MSKTTEQIEKEAEELADEFKITITLHRDLIKLGYMRAHNVINADLNEKTK